MTSPIRSFNFWPYAITAALVIFFGLVVTLVALAFRHPPELVAQDYYEQELRYQDHIDRRTRAQALPTGLRVQPDIAGDRIRLAFPPEQARQGVTGTLRLYRPSDAALDRTIALAPDAQGIQTLDTAMLLPGRWELRVEWRSGGKDFNAIEAVKIPKRSP